MPPAIKRLEAGAQARGAPVAVEPVRQHEAGQHIDLEQRDLIAPEHDQRGGDAGKQRPSPRMSDRARAPAATAPAADSKG